MRQLNFQPLIRIIIILAILASLLLLYHYLFRYIYPFIIALVITMILQPIISYFEHTYRMNRRLASYLSIFITCSMLGLLAFFLLQQIAKELGQLIGHLPNTFNMINDLFIKFGQTTLIPIYDSLQTKLFFLPKGDTFDVERTIPFITDKLYEYSHTIITNTFSSLSTMITSASQTGIVIVFILISVVIMTKDFMLIKHTYQKFIPAKVRQKGIDVLFYLKRSTLGLIKAQFLLALLTGCIVFIGFLIFQVKHVLVLTIVIFLVDFIPYIGIGTIFIPWIVFQLLSGHYILTIQLTCLYMLLIITRQFIEPKIIANHLNIHPLIALIILFASIQYFGMAGIILTPILLVIISAAYHANIFTFMFQYIFAKK